MHPSCDLERKTIANYKSNVCSKSLDCRLPFNEKQKLLSLRRRLYFLVIRMSPISFTSAYFDYIPIYHENTVMHNGPLRRQTFDYALNLSCDNNPSNVIALVLHDIEDFVLTSKLVLRATPRLFKTKHIHICNRPKNFHCTTSWKRFLCWINKFLVSCLLHETVR